MAKEKENKEAELQEEKPKRKTALIKHRKPPVGDKQPDKKRVVVVKKKVVKVKRAKPVDAEDKPSEPVKATIPAPRSVEVERKASSPRQSRPGYLGSSPREPSPFDVRTTGTSRSTTRMKSEEETLRTPGSKPEAKPGTQRTFRTQVRKPDARTGRPDARTGRPDARSGRPDARSGRPDARSGRPDAQRTFRKVGGSPPGGPGRPGGPPRQKKEETGTDDAKHPGKKFYKTKRHPAYPKKIEEEHVEKLIQVRKKNVQRANPVPKQIDILERITVSELAKKMNLKASELIGKLMEMGMMVTINQQIDSATAGILADEYECKVNVVSLYDETVIEEETDAEEEILPRPPIVTVMGHVDHGKTLLLDVIRESNVVASEAGGITQHIGAYTVDLPQGKIVFLDTPGHEAFTSMRARGAQVTDIVILVVAANDGVMPQTIEAINHSKAAKVPILVVVNKMDLEEANPERVKQQLAEYELLPENWGGQTLFCEVSALKKQGIDVLLDSIILQSEMLELNADYSCRAQGRVLESRIDHGRGIVSTVLVERGTLSVGDAFVAGVFPGRVRAMFNDKGEPMEKATPSIPVEILGFTGLPDAGDPFQVTEDEKAARLIGGKRQELKKMEAADGVNKVTLDNLYDQIKQGEVQELNVIVKGDVHGSVEALQTALERLSTDEIRLSVIHASAGAINRNDVLLATTSNAIIVGFHVRATSTAQSLAEREKVEIRRYNIIYDAVDDIKAAMEGLLAPELKEETIGALEVRDIFKVPRIGTVAGCFVNTGKITRGAQAIIVRDGVEVYRGKVSSLRRFKDDAREVESGYECGVGIENFNDIKVGDAIEVIEIKKVSKTLEGVRSDSRSEGRRGARNPEKKS